MTQKDPIEPLLASGKVALAVPLLEAALARMPTGWKPREEHPDRFEIAFWEQGEFIGFVAHDKPTKNVIWKTPNYARYCYYLAFAAVERQDLASAERWVDRGLALEPDQALLLSEKALILGYTKRRPAAIEAYLRAASVAKLYMRGWKARALRGAAFELIEARELERAEKCLRESLELEPNHPVAKNELQVIADLRKGGVKGLPSGLTRGGGESEAQKN